MPRWIETGHDLRYTTPEMLALERGMVATAQARCRRGRRGGPTRATVAAAIAARRRSPRTRRPMIEDVCLSPAGVVVDRGRRRGGQDLRARRVPRGLRCLRRRGRRLRPGRACRGACSRRVRTSPRPDGDRHAPRAPGRPPAPRRRARGRRGGHARRPPARRAGLTRGAGRRQAGGGRRSLRSSSPSRRGHRCAP